MPDDLRSWLFAMMRLCFFGAVLDVMLAAACWPQTGPQVASIFLASALAFAVGGLSLALRDGVKAEQERKAWKAKRVKAVEDLMSGLKPKDDDGRS